MSKHIVSRTVVAASAVILLALSAAWSAEPAAPASNTDPAAVHAQMLSLCEALKPRGGSCGARKPGGNDSAPMSSAAAPAGDAPSDAALKKPVDAWGKPLRISIDNGGLRLQSSGADGEMNSADDLVERCPIE